VGAERGASPDEATKLFALEMKHEQMRRAALREEIEEVRCSERIEEQAVEREAGRGQAFVVVGGAVGGKHAGAAIRDERKQTGRHDAPRDVRL
jgi:hypothetical protein